MLRDAIGLDIGGANLKAATSTGLAVCRPFELWKYPDRLTSELIELVAGMPDAPLAVTMTGELCDCFPTKRDGVRHILAATRAAFPDGVIRVWSTAGGFVSVETALEGVLAVASANWHALATYAGRFVPKQSAILIDCGSTTTDIIPILDGLPAPRGTTDTERMFFGELVYTGSRRTPICAVLGSYVAAEFFATMHDAYLCLGRLPDEPDNCNTADGRPATSEFAHARLSRMLCGDPEITREGETLELAEYASAVQEKLIVDAVGKVASRLAARPEVFIVAGSGEFLVRSAGRFVPGFREKVKSLSDPLGSDVSTAACAYAVAVLAEECDEIAARR
jgi:(4-(4-[2-(gamma-L-glutamylamino)ethyl]phenoxymethyl)furan-2-yl)methanamine synthase